MKHLYDSLRLYAKDLEVKVEFFNTDVEYFKCHLTGQLCDT